MASPRGLELRRTVALLSIAALGLGVAACGEDKGSDPAAGKGSVTKLTVAAVPFASAIPLHYAVESGVFEKHGLDVEVTPVATGSDGIAAAVSGDAPITYAGMTHFISAVAKGLPLKAITNASQYARGTSGVVASAKSGIKTAPDLNGKTIAVNSLQSQSDIFLHAASDALGADSKTFKVIAVPFPEQQAALKAGQVDAAWMGAPFYNAALKEGGVSVIDGPVEPVFGTTKNVSQDVYATTDQFLAKDPDTVDAFRDAINEATRYVQDNPDVIPATLASFTEFTEEQATGLPMPIFSPVLDVDVNQKYADMMLDYKFVTEAVTLSEHVALGDQ